MGKVETYLADVIEQMINSLRKLAENSVIKYPSMSKKDWIAMDPAQVTLLVNLCNWVISVEGGFKQLASNKNAMASCFTEQIDSLTNLI